jgi:hypothetical protein
MNTGNKPINETGPRDPDADISLLLYKTGKAFKQFFLWIARCINKLGSAVLVTLLFLFRNFIWLLIGAALGIAYGVFKESKSSAYTSQMVVKANYNSARSVYNTIDYVNALISANQTASLARFFGITEAEAAQLSDFEIEPVQSELITADLYKQEFFQPERDKKIRLDTFWTRTIKYEDFKESLTKYDYPYQAITAYTTNPFIFSKLAPGISQHIGQNTLLSAVNEQQAKSNAGEELLLESSLRGLDSLRKAYNERLTKGESTVPPGNQMTVMQGTQEATTPELDLYDKMLRMQDELKKSRARSATEKNVIEIYSPFNPVGKKVSFVQSVSWSAFYGFLAALIILLLISIYKWLVVFEASQSAKRKKAIV